ncbi:protein of unknown function [Aminobacter niigataensis]|nr:protein of unknown function [Aminobacter niigataensis]
MAMPKPALARQMTGKTAACGAFASDLFEAKITGSNSP